MNSAFIQFLEFELFFVLLVIISILMISLNEKIFRTTMVYRSLSKSFNIIAKRTVSFFEGIEIAKVSSFLTSNEVDELHKFRILRNDFIHSSTNDIPEKVISNVLTIDKILKKRINNEDEKGFFFRLTFFLIIIIIIVYIMLLFS